MVDHNRPGRLSGNKFIVLGDAMIDRTYRGTIHRISPEAPVPILDVTDLSDTLGGAGNVAANIASLAGEWERVSLLTIGWDDALADGGEYSDLCIFAHVDAQSPDTERHIPVKARLIAGNQQVYRFDIEERRDITESEEAGLLEMLSRGFDLHGCRALVIADYRKGVCTPSLVRDAIESANDRQIPVFVDTKPDAARFYKGATLIKLNRDEASHFLGAPVSAETRLAAEHLRTSVGATYVVITLAGDGMLYAGPEGSGHVPAYPGAVVDVTGAGDTVLAALAVAMTDGMEIKEACEFAAECAADVVSRTGTSAVKTEREYVSL